jgi:hypothetical protein
MFHLEARIKSILFKQFQYIKNKSNLFFYCFSIFWLKFQMKNSLKNFNIIPGGLEKDRPKFFDKMIEAYLEFISFKKDETKEKNDSNSKEVYNKFRKGFEEKPFCEKNDLLMNDWKGVYKSINNKKLHAEWRSFYFRVLNNGVSLDLKNPWRKKNKCVLCDKKNKTRDHIFLECEYS